MHIILPATETNDRLCKTLLSLTILDYPSPRILGWKKDEEGAHENRLLGGGSHFIKIEGTLEYIEEHLTEPAQQDDLVIVFDAYDVWAQLPLEVLLARYSEAVADENTRVAKRMGTAYTREHIKSTILFAAGKRCAPNALYTVACYPLPESPLPKDLYGAATDTSVGHTFWSSYRTRYLNSGFFMGPVRDLRPLLVRAKAKMDECIDRKHAWFDDGGGSSDQCYHGSDQSIFAEIFGEQEFHREVMRRHHMSWYERGSSNSPVQSLFGARVDDVLDPAFAHESRNKTYLAGKPFEFGVAMDYWSSLSHQTSNAYWDTEFIRYDANLTSQTSTRTQYDCPAKSPYMNQRTVNELEATMDILNKSQHEWQNMPFYTELCVGKIPVMIHQNSVDKSQIVRQWNHTWWAGEARQLLDLRRNLGSASLTEGFPLESGRKLRWNEVCPGTFDAEVFRDVPGALNEHDDIYRYRSPPTAAGVEG